MSRVLPGSAAERDGCAVGDQLVEVDGAGVVGCTQPALLGLLAPEDAVWHARPRTLTLVRPAAAPES